MGAAAGLEPATSLPIKSGHPCSDSIVVSKVLYPLSYAALKSPHFRAYTRHFWEAQE